MSTMDVNPANRSLETYDPTPVFRHEHAEGRLTRLVEQQTAKLPSDAFLFAALASMAASLAFELAGNQRASRFIGMWAPSLLTMGVYNKLVKVLGPR
jgi:hypothetical protein